MPTLPIRIEIFGETKTIKEWAADYRCEVSGVYISERYRAGIRGEELIYRNDPRGRTPDKKRKEERMDMASTLKGLGKTLKEVNEDLRELRMGRITKEEYNSLPQ